MAKINLLPHREERRKQRKKSFFTMLGLAAAMGGAIILAVGGYLANNIANQAQRNEFIKGENTKLDNQIKEILLLKQEIEALQARQQAVEDLQADRNQPVYLMDELARQTPEGIYLRSFKQDGQRVVLSGYAQSNERVSEFLRNLSNRSPWLQQPDLIEIRSVGLGAGKDAKKVFDFTINVGIKRPRDKDKSMDGAVAGSDTKSAPSKSPSEKVPVADVPAKKSDPAIAEGNASVKKP